MKLNTKKLLTGAAGLLGGSFIIGGIHKIIKSRKETDAIVAETEEKIAESKALIAKSIEQLEETDKLQTEIDDLLAQAKRTQMAIESTWSDLAEIAGEEEVKRFRNITFTTNEFTTDENDEWEPLE